MDNNDVLIHWGIKGQKWGRRRFQNKDGSLTPAGKERYDDDNDSEEKIETPEERKARIIKSGSAAEVMQYQGQLSNNELRAVSERIRIENELNKVAAEQRTRGVDKFNQIMNDVDKVRGGVEKGLNAWNLIAKINNTFNEKQLPEINGKYFKSDAIKKKADEAEAKAKKDREEALRKVTPEEAAKNADKYTTAELQDLNKRYAALDGINSKVKKNSSNDGDNKSNTDKSDNKPYELKGKDSKEFEEFMKDKGTATLNSDNDDKSILGRISRLTGQSKADLVKKDKEYNNTDIDSRESAIKQTSKLIGKSEKEVQQAIDRVASGKGSDLDKAISDSVYFKNQSNDIAKSRRASERKAEEAAAKTRSDALKSLVSKARSERTETKVTSLKDVKDKETNASISNLSDDAIRSAIARAKAGTGSSRDKDILAKYGNVVVSTPRIASGSSTAKKNAMSTRIANAMANADKKKKKNK